MIRLQSSHASPLEASTITMPLCHHFGSHHSEFHLPEIFQTVLQKNHSPCEKLNQVELPLFRNGLKLQISKLQKSSDPPLPRSSCAADKLFVPSRRIGGIVENLITDVDAQCHKVRLDIEVFFPKGRERLAHAIHVSSCGSR